MTTTPRIDGETTVTRGTFVLLCLGGYLLSIAYGVTFLIPLLVAGRGGDASLAGVVISSATLTTVMFVILSGHIADALGSALAIGVAALFLATSAVGFALTDSSGWPLVVCGLVLGIGWGLFYTLGPILVAAMIEPARRAHHFALLSGSMMMGIGTGPILGRTLGFVGFQVETAFLAAALASVVGGGLFVWVHVALARANVQPSGSRISMESTILIIRSPAIWPIAMVGLGACIFGGLSSFQTSYAAERGLDYALFFIGFIAAAILGRLFLAGAVVRREPHGTALLLTGMTALSVVLFLFYDLGQLGYILVAALLGAGYGLTYSVINGLVAAEAPEGLIPQALLLFSLAYFIGVFGFPLLGGHLIADYGTRAMLAVLIGVSVLNMAIPAFRRLRL